MNEQQLEELIINNAHLGLEIKNEFFKALLPNQQAKLYVHPRINGNLEESTLRLADKREIDKEKYKKYILNEFDDARENNSFFRGHCHGFLTGMIND